jgi:class 3 adenylate cyclase
VGDGILIYFGYPVAHEDNAERAMRAGLDLVSAVVKLANDQFAGLNVRVRVGIATGLVVVGSAGAEASRTVTRLSARRPIWLPACRAWPNPTR